MAKLLNHPHVHGVHATVHENWAKHTPNIIFNQMQLIESVENAYFSNGLFSFQIFKLIHFENAIFM
jgi:hypothetical protein